MATEPSYEIGEIARIIEEASAFFDVVRLVDPVSMVVYSVEDGEVREQLGTCSHVWGKVERCENCISARCFIDGKRYSKFEFIDQDIYHVVAQRVVVDGRPFVLEVVTASNDNVLLTAFGNNDFVERITRYNRKVYTDELTGLSNRRFLDERFGITVDRAAHGNLPLAVVMIDIDDFKDVNDTRGHLSGDKVLACAAQAILRGLDPGNDDIVARYGGDEFFAVLGGLSREELAAKLERIRAIAQEENVGVTFSIGAFYQDPVRICDTRKLVLRADRAMYGVKSVTKDAFAILE